ncbi:uncharacterized protein LOC123532433 [Mercenaria mercenaria]|uniref:uncharacterized protein LOC123532433 n=1 Tax=Mercenaria mercenaria TaxID=6596 RepID=UPI00234EDD8F|nr:uncharacterized protein LOC123532433 [Mercenaria mercenaria]
MAPESYIAVLLMISVPGNADLLTKTLLERIEALEKRDTEQIARIDLLAEQALVSTEKLKFLSASNDNLQIQFSYQAKKMKEQEDIIAELRKDIKHHRTVTDKYRRHVNILEAKMKQMDVGIERIHNVFADKRENYQDESEETKDRKMKTDGRPDKIKSNGVSVIGLTTNTTKENDTGNLEMEKEGLAKIHNKDTDLKTVANTLNKEATDTLHGTNNGQPRWNDIKQHAARSLTNPVAFHAVRTQLTQQHPQLNDAVKFEDVLLNQGNGYYGEHGLFIAPQPGLYLFSTSITCNSSPGHLHVQASVVKNGNRLARVYCHGDEYSSGDQGSVTVVTQLYSADTIWVRFDWPDGGYILGNGFTSFTGIQIM